MLAAAVLGWAALFPTWTLLTLCAFLGVPIGAALLVTPLEPPGMSKFRTPPKRDVPVWERDPSWVGPLTPEEGAAILQVSTDAARAHAQPANPATLMRIAQRNDALAGMVTHPLALPGQSAPSTGLPLRGLLWNGVAPRERLGPDVPLADRLVSLQAAPPLPPKWWHRVGLLLCGVLPGVLWAITAAAVCMDSLHSPTQVATDASAASLVTSQSWVHISAAKAAAFVPGAVNASSTGTFTLQLRGPAHAWSGFPLADARVSGWLLVDQATCGAGGPAFAGQVYATAVGLSQLLLWGSTASAHFVYRGHPVVHLPPMLNRLWLAAVAFVLVWGAVALEGLVRVQLAAFDAACVEVQGTFALTYAGSEVARTNLSIADVLGDASSAAHLVWPLAAPWGLWIVAAAWHICLGNALFIQIKDVEATSYETDQRSRRAYFDTRLGMYSPR